MNLVISQDKGSKTQHHQMPRSNADASTADASGSATRGKLSLPSEAFASALRSRPSERLSDEKPMQSAVFYSNNQGALQSVKGKANEFYHLRFYCDRN